MAGPLQRGDQPDVGQTQPFAQASQSQYPHSQYQYHTSDYPSLDSELDMPNNYPPPAQPHMATQLHDNSVTSAPRNGNLRGIDVNASDPGAPGMAPPHTPSQPGFSPPGHRPSMDDAADPAITGESSKRKRSKVSRACDECRRKKIKCDAAAEDGTIKTCTNCTKAGLTCEYSRIPMKRGPSKGYIKELSERVQQVESLQAAMSGPGYRQSLDSNSNPAFAEPFSPEDPLSRRNFSFPDTRSPFAASDFQRDRIPSTGGWGPTSPLGQSFRFRDRGSLAIAPDQQIPPTSHAEISKPFWSADYEQPPPAKRRKMLPEDLGSVTFSAEQLSNYYSVIHPNLPLLPNLDTTINILQTAAPAIQHIFSIAIDLVPTAAIDPPLRQNGDKMDIVRPSPSIFARHENLSDEIFESCKTPLGSRAESETLILVWSYILLAVCEEYRISLFSDNIISRRNLIKQAVETVSHLKRGLRDDKIVNTSIDSKTYSELVERAWEMAIMLAKLNSLATGTRDFLLLSDYGIHTDRASKLPTIPAFLARISNTISTIAYQIQDTTLAQSGLMITSKHLTLHCHFMENVLQTNGLDQNTPIVVQTKAFFELLLSRSNFISSPTNILPPTVALAEALTSTPPTASAPFIYSPIEMHLFVLATITLLEVLSSISDPDISTLAETALNKLQPLLEQKAEQHKINKTDAAKLFWKSLDNERSGKDDEIKVSSWAEILLRMIADRKKADWAIKTNEVNGSGGAGAGPTSAGPTISSNNLLVDFGMLLKFGYANVLGKYA